MAGVFVLCAVLAGVCGFIPASVLGAIAVAAVVDLLELRYMHYLWRSSKTDLFIVGVVFCLTLAFGVGVGFLGGVGVHLLVRAAVMTRPRYCSLSSSLSLSLSLPLSLSSSLSLS